MKWITRFLPGKRQQSEKAASMFGPTDGLFSPIAVHKFRDYADYLQAGSKKVWATWRAIDIIANSVKTTPWQVLRQGSTTEVKIEGLERLMRYPNENETWRDFIYKTVFHYRLTGMAYWYKSEANLKGDRPRNLYTLNPKNVEIVPDPETGIKGYLFNVNGRKIPFERDEIMLFRRPHPNSDVHGLGDIEAAEPLLNEFINRGTVLEKFYQNGAQPSGLLINQSTNAPSEEEWEKAKKKWQAQYGGLKNAGKLAWLTGSWTYQQLGMSAQEMQDIERTKYTVEQIFLLHGVPLSVAGIRDAANFATADIDNQRFREYTVLPDVLTMQDTINTDLVQGFDPRAELRFNVAGLINVGKLMVDYSPLFDRGGLTINELRGLAGLPQDEGNELWNATYINAGFVPLDLSGISAPGGVVDQQADAAVEKFVKDSLSRKALCR